MSAPKRHYDVVLPIGWSDEDGQLHRKAVIRKMSGHEEALLYDPALSSAELVSELLKGCLIRVGDRSDITSELVGKLYSADRSYLIVELRRATLGDTLQSSYLCPSCHRETLVVEDLSKIDVRRLEDGVRPGSVRVELEDGYEDRDGAVHMEITLRLPRGADEEAVARGAEKDALRARDLMILRCIESFGRLPRAALEAYGLKILRDLTIGDRRRIYKALEEKSPGVDFRRQIVCAHCGLGFDAILEVGGFFDLG